MMRWLPIFLIAFAANGTTTDTIHIQEDGGGDYTELGLAENGEDRDIVASDEIVILQLEESWTNPDTTGVAFDGWTTDATRYIVIQTDGASKHDGKRYGSPSTAYRLEATGTNGLLISENYVRVYGLQVKVIINSSSFLVCIYPNVVAAGGSDIRIGYCIFTSSTTSSGNAVGSGSTDTDVTMSMFNTLIYGMTSGTGFGFYQSLGVVNIYNCTFFNCDVAIEKDAATMNVYNTIIQDSATDGFVGIIGGNYNRSDRAADAPGANSINDTDDVLFVSTTGGSEDFHLSASEVSNPNATSVIDYTSDLSSGLFADDIDYVTRTGSWDIGADEYVAAAGGAVVRRPIIVIH